MYWKIAIVTTRISDLQQCCHYLSNALVYDIWMAVLPSVAELTRS